MVVSNLEYIKRERIDCPICGKNVAVSFRGRIIRRHVSAIKRLNGCICSASGCTPESLRIDCPCPICTGKAR